MATKSTITDYTQMRLTPKNKPLKSGQIRKCPHCGKKGLIDFRGGVIKMWIHKTQTVSMNGFGITELISTCLAPKKEINK